MKPATRINLYPLIGLLLPVPTAYFILISLMKYEFGWNINLLILFGPVPAIILNMLSVIKIRFQFTKERYDCQVSITKKWWNLAVVLVSAISLLMLFAYLVAENPGHLQVSE